jgi:hypothetical protein
MTLTASGLRDPSPSGNQTWLAGKLSGKYGNIIGKYGKVSEKTILNGGLVRWEDHQWRIFQPASLLPEGNSLNSIDTENHSSQSWKVQSSVPHFAGSKSIYSWKVKTCSLHSSLMFTNIAISTFTI